MRVIENDNGESSVEHEHEESYASNTFQTLKKPKQKKRSRSKRKKNNKTSSIANITQTGEVLTHQPIEELETHEDDDDNSRDTTM